MHYVRFDTVTGLRELDTQPAWGGTNYSLNALHGDCSTRRDRLDSTIYCVSSTTDGDANPANDDDRLAVVVTTDNGQTWQDYAATNPTPGCNECYFAISTARQIDESSRILGTFNPQPKDPNHAGPVKFFSVPVPSPTLVRFPAAVTTNAAAPLYPALHAGDNNPATEWVASLTTSLANNNAWIQLDLLSVKEVRHVRWNAAGSPAPTHSPAHYKLKASTDGVHWTDVNTRTYDFVITNGDRACLSHGALSAPGDDQGERWIGIVARVLGVLGRRIRAAVRNAGARGFPRTGCNVSSQQGSYPGGYAIDGNASTTWVASSANAPQRCVDSDRSRQHPADHPIEMAGRPLEPCWGAVAVELPDRGVPRPRHLSHDRHSNEPGGCPRRGCHRR